MRLIVALTGGIGSGKSRVAEMLGDLGAAIIDTDVIAHQLTAPGQPGALAIGAEFGTAFLQADGALDRKRMRARVFSKPAAKARLEAILHPMIRASVHTAVQDAQGNYVVIVVPLLIETGAYRDLAQRILVVDCSEAQQVARVMQRNGYTADAVQAIMASQATRAARLAHADDIVRNEAGLETLRAEVAALHRKYLVLAGAAGTAGHA